MDADTARYLIALTCALEASRSPWTGLVEIWAGGDYRHGINRARQQIIDCARALADSGDLDEWTDLIRDAHAVIDRIEAEHADADAEAARCDAVLDLDAEGQLCYAHAGGHTDG